MTEHTPTIDDLRTRLEEYALEYSHVPRAVTAAEFDRCLAKHDAEQAASIAALCGAAYNRGYREAEREWQRAGDGEGLT